MNRLLKYQHFCISILLATFLFTSCKDFYETDQDLDVTESQLYGDWYEYRSTVMGLYGLQQNLVEQLVILGELRGDLLQITPNADADMIEIYNFSVSKNNKYASPVNFFKLIAASNSFIRNITEKHPEVLNANIAIKDYDRLYAEALCMRAWAYFNAVRIYGKVPYIHESLVTLDEIENYVNSLGKYRDTVNIVYDGDGYHYTSIPIDTVLDKQYYDLHMVVNTFIRELETKIKFQEGQYGIGVDYARLNDDYTWEVTTWHPFSMHALLGQMYLTVNNYIKAVPHFESILKNNSINDRYELDKSFKDDLWKTIFTGTDIREHIYTIPFSKANYQQNDLQNFFVTKFMLKPTKYVITNWENCWRFQIIAEDPNTPANSKMTDAGVPFGDYYRGYGTSYVYKKTGGGVVSATDYMKMRTLTSKLDFRGANSIMDGTDTVVNKYTIGKNVFENDSTKIPDNDVFANDANYIIYRAAGIHLYLAEIYNYWKTLGSTGLNTQQGLIGKIINNGAYYDDLISRTQLGVRGRVGLGSGYEAIKVTTDIIYNHDPYTNEIKGFTNYYGNIQAKTDYLENLILNERALELAFEGERFYDLMRFAKRKGDPTFLAKKVAAKFPDGERQAMEIKLSNEENWYIHYFD